MYYILRNQYVLLTEKSFQFNDTGNKVVEGYMSLLVAKPEHDGVKCRVAHPQTYRHNQPITMSNSSYAGHQGKLVDDSGQNYSIT